MTINLYLEYSPCSKRKRLFYSSHIQRQTQVSLLDNDQYRVLDLCKFGLSCNPTSKQMDVYKCGSFFLLQCTKHIPRKANAIDDGVPLETTHLFFGKYSSYKEVPKHTQSSFDCHLINEQLPALREPLFENLGTAPLKTYWAKTVAKEKYWEAYSCFWDVFPQNATQINEWQLLQNVLGWLGFYCCELGKDDCFAFTCQVDVVLVTLAKVFYLYVKMRICVKKDDFI